MRRYVHALVLAGSVLALAGCGGALPEADLPVGPAPPQRHQLDWEERSPATGEGIVYRVRSLEVTTTGWRAEIGIDNQTSVTWRLGNAVEVLRAAPVGRFGLLVLSTDDHERVERANTTRQLPPIRRATSIVPALPTSLAPGALWDGTIEGTGRLPGGLWVRVSFGLMTTDDELPDGMQNGLIWFTDHAVQLAPGD